MNFVRLLPAILSLLVLGAHFLRTGYLAPVLICILLPLVLLVRRPWAARLIQFVLLLACAEWIRTLILLIGARADSGSPWLRMALILGAVAAVALVAAVMFQHRALRERYRI